MKTGAIEEVNVADAKRRLSDLLGRVAYGGETVLITRRGRPMARLVPAVGASDELGLGLGSTRGWLDDDDPFFAVIDARVAARTTHRPRAGRTARRKTR